MNRAWTWNEVRDHTEWKFSFEMRLLSEEVKETYKAIAKKDLIEIVDGICDMRFVFDGSRYKFGLLFDGNPTQASVVDEHQTEWKIYSDYYVHHMKVLNLEAFRYLGSKSEKILEECYNAVCDANDKKPLDKDSGGKTIKGEDFISPNEKISEILESYKEDITYAVS